MTAQAAIRARFQTRWPGMKLTKRLPPFNTAT
jgi:hypothetical protein